MLPNHEQIRALFPGTSDKAFLDAACVSLTPTVAVEAIKRFLDDAMHCPEESATAQHIAMDRAREVARREAARLLNAATEEIALVESTTAGLNAIVSALPLAEGDNAVICDLEFMQVAIPLVNLQRLRGIEIRPVRHRQGIVTADDFARACDERTRLIMVSSVQWSHGLKHDLAALSEIAAARGAWLIVDAIQQAGADEIDLSRLGIDALACGGHKWLNAPFGCGFLYVNRRRLPEVEPMTRGYLTLQAPDGGWGTYFSTPTITPFRDYRYVSDAAKFETGGTSNYPGATGLGASLRLINQIGPPAIEDHVRDLSRVLIEELKRLGLSVVTPDDDRMRAGIVTFRISDDPAEDPELVRFLAERRVYVSARYTAGIGGTRVSVHFFNDRDDLARLIEGVRDYLARRD